MRQDHESHRQHRRATLLGIPDPPMPALIKALRQMFAEGCVMPVRHHHRIEVPGEPKRMIQNSCPSGMPFTVCR